MRSLCSFPSPLISTIATVATIVTFCVGQAEPVLAQGSNVAVSANFSNRTSLQVSTQTLQFHVDETSAQAVAFVEFSAGARTAAHAPVVLSVEPLKAVHGPGGAADVEVALGFEGQGEGMLTGSLNTGGPVTVGRWVGGGYRQGRVVFHLRSGAPGTYTVPVRFVLTTP